MKASIAPFYVGQKVVYITGEKMPRGSIHCVRGLCKMYCGCWMIDVGISNGSSATYYCQDCDPDRLGTCRPPYQSLWFASEAFRPVQEQSFPLMKFEKIVEREKEEILIPN